MPSCISLMNPPPAASASPVSSPIASMSVPRTTSPCNRLRWCCTLYPTEAEVQHFVALLLETGTSRAQRLARRRFLAPERLDMSALAQELGVNRVTLYRWVGSRDKLLAEVAWALARAGARPRQEPERRTGSRAHRPDRHRLPAARDRRARHAALALGGRRARHA